ncbi:hypothetical protein EJB05_18027, partial [Eragrostis curvula]
MPRYGFLVLDLRSPSTYAVGPVPLASLFEDEDGWLMGERRDDEATIFHICWAHNEKEHMYFLLTLCLNLCSPLQYKEMSEKSFEQNASKVDRMEHYKSTLSELLSKKDDSLSNGVKDLSNKKTQNKGRYGHDSDRDFPLFLEKINGLSKNDKKILKHTVHEIITLMYDDVDEVDRDVQAMEGSGEIHQNTVTELYSGLLGKLGKMAKSVDGLLNIAASKCRPMTTDEKIELGKRIRKLPEEALDRVVEIISAGKPASQSSDRITLKLGELDDATLWRLCYHVEAVLKENKI